MCVCIKQPHNTTYMPNSTNGYRSSKQTRYKYIKPPRTLLYKFGRCNIIDFTIYKHVDTHTHVQMNGDTALTGLSIYKTIEVWILQTNVQHLQHSVQHPKFTPKRINISTNKTPQKINTWNS